MTTDQHTTDRVLAELARIEWELNRCVFDGTLDADTVLRSLQLLVTGGRSRRTRDLIHGLFVPPADQVDNVRRWNELYLWGFTERDFSDIGAPPSWPDGDLLAVVLVPSLATVQ